MSKLRKWLIKKVIKNEPVIMNVTIYTEEEIKAPKPDGVFDKCYIGPNPAKNKSKTAVIK